LFEKTYETAQKNGKVTDSRFLDVELQKSENCMYRPTEKNLENAFYILRFSDFENVENVFTSFSRTMQQFRPIHQCAIKFYN